MERQPGQDLPTNNLYARMSEEEFNILADSYRMAQTEREPGYYAAILLGAVAFLAMLAYVFLGET